MLIKNYENIQPKKRSSASESEQKKPFFIQNIPWKLWFRDTYATFL